MRKKNKNISNFTEIRFPFQRKVDRNLNRNENLQKQEVQMNNATFK